MYFPIGWPKKLKFQFKECPSGQDGESKNNGHHTQDDHLNDNCDSRLLQVVANSDRSLFVILTPTSVHVWFSKPSVEIVSHSRSRSSIDTLGQNESVHWRPDSTMIVVKDDRVEFVFQQKDVTTPGLKELIIPDKIPGLYLIMSFSTKVTPGISSFLAAEEEVVVATRTGELIGINWDGNLDENFRWEVSDGSDEGFIVRDLKYSSMIGGFSLVFDNGKLAFLPIHYNPQENESSQEVTNQGQPPVTSTNSKKVNQRRISLPNVSPRVQFVQDMTGGDMVGVTSGINHKYQLISFGLKNSEGILCVVDEENSVLLVTHRMVLPSSSFPDHLIAAIGPMTTMQWSPDSTVLATGWENGGVALWSVFGALLMCSLSWDYGQLNMDHRLSPGHFVTTSVAWSREGYQLWMVGTSQNASNGSSTSNGQPKTSSLMQISMAKSILTSNPSSCSCQESLLMVTEDKLYLGVGASTNGSNTNSQTMVDPVVSGAKVANDFASSSPSPSMTESTNSSSTNSSGYISGVSVSASRASRLTRKKSTIEEEDANIIPTTNVSSSRMEFRPEPVEIGSHQWIVIQIPFSYLSVNWPIRLAALDASGQLLVVAGRSGFAIYSLVNRKWKLFGNEGQEKDFEVCGGIVFHDNHVIVACFNIAQSEFELRSYPASTRLDNQFMRGIKVPSEVLVMSTHGDKMVTLHNDGSINLFGLSSSMNRKRDSISSVSSLSSQPSPTTVHIIPLSQIVVSNLVIPPECVVSLFLTSLHVEPPQPSTMNDMTDSILVNVCGRVFLLEKEPTSPRYGHDRPPLVYRAVSILASGVENLWVSPPRRLTDGSSDRPHLEDALWLSRGCHGMNVWLPLLQPSSGPTRSDHQFISRRIMLPINTHIYPLAILFRDAVVIGAENDSMFFGSSCPTTLPYSTMTRTSQVYLHHILRELLKRNLGIHAWNIASSCTSLPHFPHSLELLLHETLEEEATTSQPIPDALLPRVVSFIREFPSVFLQTIVHCARKTELALWPHLFAVVGNPKVLFETCLDQGLLETAASYLLVLHNLERTSVSRRYAILLIDAAQMAGKRKLASDLTRFLNSIDPNDFESPPFKSGSAGPSTLPPLGALSLHSVKYHHHHHVPVSVPHLDHHYDGLPRKRTSSSSASLMLHSPTGSTNVQVTNPPTLSTATTVTCQSVPTSPDAKPGQQMRISGPRPSEATRRSNGNSDSVFFGDGESDQRNDHPTKLNRSISEPPPSPHQPSMATGNGAISRPVVNQTSSITQSKKPTMTTTNAVPRLEESSGKHVYTPSTGNGSIPHRVSVSSITTVTETPGNQCSIS